MEKKEQHKTTDQNDGASDRIAHAHTPLTTYQMNRMTWSTGILFQCEPEMWQLRKPTRG